MRRNAALARQMGEPVSHLRRKFRIGGQNIGQGACRPMVRGIVMLDHSARLS